MGKLALVGAVIIHHPDFFVAGAVADEINFAFRDAGNAAAEAKNDFVGKFVRDQAGRVIGGNIGVLLAQDQRRGGVLYVVEPALHRDFACCHAEIAEGQHGGVGRR